LVHFPLKLLLHSRHISPIIPTLPQGSTRPYCDQFRTGIRTATVCVFPPQTTLLILFSSHLFIYIFISSGGLIVIHYLALSLFFLLQVILFHICFPTVLAVCFLGFPSSYMLVVSTPLSSYWLSSHVSLPLCAFQFLCYRLSFLLGILTREDGTDTLSRNIGK
jgi:hypothetical protein